MGVAKGAVHSQRRKRHRLKMLLGKTKEVDISYGRRGKYMFIRNTPYEQSQLIKSIEQNKRSLWPVLISFLCNPCCGGPSVMCAFFANEEVKKAHRAIQLDNMQAAHYRASNAYWLSKTSFVTGSIVALIPIMVLLIFTIKFMDVMATGVPMSAIIEIFWSCQFGQYEQMNPCACMTQLSDMKADTFFQMPKAVYETCYDAFIHFRVHLDFIKVQPSNN